jgi:hypothetical protein
MKKTEQIVEERSPAMGPLTAVVVAAEFIPEGDPYRDDKEEPPRAAGTYVTLRLDDMDAAVVGGRVRIEYLPVKDH